MEIQELLMESIGKDVEYFPQDWQGFGMKKLVFNKWNCFRLTFPQYGGIQFIKINSLTCVCSSTDIREKFDIEKENVFIFYIISF